VTFATYAVGMLALAGFPLFFSGFWSKDEILHAAYGWPISQGPFYLGLAGAFLTAFYMTRQVTLVFFGRHRSRACESADHSHLRALNPPSHDGGDKPREGPASMTWPLLILAVCAVALSAIGTPAWPWFQSFLGGPHGETGFTQNIILLMALSSLVVFAGLGLGWWLYGRKPVAKADAPDVLEHLPAGVYTWLQQKYGIDQLYEISVIRFNAWGSRVCAFLDDWIWGGAVMLVSFLMLGLSWVNHVLDEFVINLGFDQGCERVTRGGRLLSRLQDGRVEHYLRVIGVALVALVLILIWGGGK